MSLQLDVRKWLSPPVGEPYDLGVTIELMDHPYLLPFAFRGCDGVYDPRVLEEALLQACRMAYERMKPEQAKDRMLRILKDPSKLENGLVGAENLPIEEIERSMFGKQTVLGVTGATLSILRYGSCLALRCADSKGDLHEEMGAVLSEMALSNSGRLWPFVRSYRFSVGPRMIPHQRTSELDLKEEMTAMGTYLPHFKWRENVNFGGDLVGNFVSCRKEKGVPVGSYGDAKVFLRLTTIPEATDSMWCQGLIENVTGDAVFFRDYNNFPKIRMEYSLQTVGDCIGQPPQDVDYEREQHLLKVIARILFGGLWHRHYRTVLSLNEHLLHFRKPKVA